MAEFVFNSATIYTGLQQVLESDCITKVSCDVGKEIVYFLNNHLYPITIGNNVFDTDKQHYIIDNYFVMIKQDVFKTGLILKLSYRSVLKILQPYNDACELSDFDSGSRFRSRPGSGSRFRSGSGSGSGSGFGSEIGEEMYSSPHSTASVIECQNNEQSPVYQPPTINTPKSKSICDNNQYSSPYSPSILSTPPKLTKTNIKKFHTSPCTPQNLVYRKSRNHFMSSSISSPQFPSPPSLVRTDQRFLNLDREYFIVPGGSPILVSASTKRQFIESVTTDLN